MGISVIGVAAFASSCDDFSTSHLEFVNRTDSPVIRLTVIDGNEARVVGNLAPHSRVKLATHLSGDAEDKHVKIAWIWKDRVYRGEMCYFTDGMPTNSTMTIVGPAIEYKCS